jgi:carboxyl-terminal processing protease
MIPKVRMLFLGALLGAILAVSLFSAGLAVGMSWSPQNGEDFTDRLPFMTAPSNDVASRTTSYPHPSPEELEELFIPFWEAWDIVHTDYVDQPVDDLDMMRGSIRGMLDALGDPHTAYMDPVEYEESNKTLEGYEGIGAWVDPDAEYLTIIAPIPGSPAEAVGLQPGDEVIAIDGEDMTGIDGNLVIRRVLGPAGSTVRLTIRRAGVVEPLEFEIVRARIIIPSVETTMLEEGIAYVQLFNFADETTRDLRDTLETILDQDPRGMILDLRFNGGGFLNTAIDVTSEFIDEGIIATERFGDGTEQVLRAKGGGLATEIPLIVLINAGSASASEIVAGAIQDYDRGLLVGETTFGKGSVQQWIPLSNDEGAVRVTIARWYTPNGRQIQQIGLEPDVEVLLTEEDIAAQIDRQLEKAIELLLSGEE